jgi:serine/threonine protein kinase
MASPEPNAHLIADRYELGRPLGRGSFGHTFLARDRDNGRDVAIKVLDPRDAPNLKARELFDREAAVLRSLRHHGIPEVFEVALSPWKDGVATFIVMEYIDGESLAQIIETQRPLDPGDVMHIFLEMLSILEYLHGRVPPILHRDIKPANILLRPDGKPSLVDFGSVRRVFRGPEEAGSTVAGTYGYMPYEQYMGQATASSDLYALGATFLHLLTGRPPREFMNDEGRIEVPLPLPGDDRLGPIIARLLRPSPTERFMTARDVRQAVLPAVARSVAVVPTAANPFLALASPRSPSMATRSFLSLGPAPRQLDEPLKDFLDRLSPGALELMSAGDDSDDSSSIQDWLSLAFFSVLTAGTLPIVYISMARNRRRKMRRYLMEGTPKVAVIQKIEIEKGPFEVPYAKVSYEFEADGRVHRGSDVILPSLADRWRPGDQIHVMYDPARAYNSVIISTQ